MHLLLLGNGFDLYFGLPTKYHNFLHTIDFLTKHYNDSVVTVGEVFGNKTLRSVDQEIEKAYNTYQECYDGIKLNKESIIEAINLARGNVWFSYLLKSFNKDIGWIDFEKEVGIVLSSFNNMFKSCRADIVYLKKLGEVSTNVDLDKYIILNAFNFWTTSLSYGGSSSYHANTDYLIEYPHGSGIKVIDKEKILRKLLDDFKYFSKLMRLYMLQFIDIPLEKMVAEKYIKCGRKLFDANIVVTLNYTNTHELLYNSSAIHLHGSTDDKIILGINPNSDDDIDTVDTTFVPFKKYFQRVQYGTDYPFITQMRAIKEEMYDQLGKIKLHRKKNHLVVFGHSLDVTDKDIIMELFDVSDTITVFHHSPRSKTSNMSNIIKMYGMDGFNKLRAEKRLGFHSISDANELRRIETLKLEEAFDEGWDSNESTCDMI